MKRLFTKSAIAIAIVGLAGSVSAGSLTGVFIGGEGLDLQPRNGDLDFVTVVPVTSPGTIYTTAIHPSYSWGWRLYAGLNFCDNEDLTVSWLRFHTNYNDDFGTPLNSPTTIAQANLRWLYQSAWSNTFSSVNFDLDEVYGVFGHTINMGPWAVRLGGGLEWARLNSDMSVGGVDTSSSDYSYSYESVSHMHGIGPRIEADATYHLPYNFSVFARTNVAMLIASREVELNGETTEPTSSAQLDDYDFSPRHVVIPKMGVKMGVGYTYGFGSMGGEGASNSSSFTVEAGWQADSYIHAIERPSGMSNQSTNQYAPYNTDMKTSNYGVQGLFVGAKLSTDWL